MSSALEHEIASQGEVLARRSEPGLAPAAAAAELLRGCRHAVIAARGSSDNAARFAQYLFGDELRLLVGLAAPWLFRTADRAPLLDGACVVAISQSGRSPDVAAVLAAARAQHCPTVVLTNALDSEMAHLGDVVVPMLAGEERSVAATKSYLASLHAVVQIVEELSPDPARRDWLGRLAAMVDALARSSLSRRADFDALAEVVPITVAGRGLFFSAACETALKLRELSGIAAEAFSPPDLMHGPIAALHPPAGTWLVNPDTDELDAVTKRMEPSVVVSSDPHALARARVAVELPGGIPDWLGSILAVVPAQAAGLRLAERGGTDVDHPHGLSKVTLTN